MKKILIAATCLIATLAVDAQYKKPEAKAAPVTANATPLQVSGARRTGTAEFPRVSQADALKLHKEGKAVFIDVRGVAQFEDGHIRGALAIPGSQLIKRYKEVPTGKTVITYCACSAEQSSGRAAADLIAHGVKNVYALKGGWSEWKAAGLPVGSGPK
jgi:rhodanese-related sulfurtransferase